MCVVAVGCVEEDVTSWGEGGRWWSEEGRGGPSCCAGQHDDSYYLLLAYSSSRINEMLRCNESRYYEAAQDHDCSRAREIDWHQWCKRILRCLLIFWSQISLSSTRNIFAQIGCFWCYFGFVTFKAIRDFVGIVGGILALADLNLLACLLPSLCLLLVACCLLLVACVSLMCVSSSVGALSSSR